MKNHILICGPVAWNTLVYLDRLPEPHPHTQFALDHFETVGGTSAGKALHLSGLGRTVVCQTVFGDDAESDRVRAALESAGITVVANSVPGESERHLNLMTHAGERVSIYLSVPGFIAPDSSRFEALSADAAALVMDLSETSRALLPTATRTGVPIWTDLHDYDGRSEFHAPFIDAASYIFMNGDGRDEPEPFMRARVEGGASAVVCTLGAEGAVAFDADGLHRVDAIAVDVVDTNGAGDAFLAGYLDATLSGGSTDEALSAAARQATVALGTKHLHPSLAEMERERGLYSSTRIILRFTNFSMPKRPSSRPKLDLLIPPNGSSGLSRPTPLMKTIPASIWEALDDTGILRRAIELGGHIKTGLELFYDPARNPTNLE